MTRLPNRYRRGMPYILHSLIMGIWRAGVAVVMQSTKRVLYACGSSRFLAFLYFFPHCLIKGTILRKKTLLNIKCVLVFSTNLSETFFILRIQLGFLINLLRFAFKVPLFWSDCNETWIFSTDFRKISNHMKIPPVETVLFHEDRETDRRTDRQTARLDELWISDQLDAQLRYIRRLLL
jgi:hypothetical protein